MVAKLYDPGQHVQEIYTDPQTGARYDATTGNQIQELIQPVSPEAICYYTSVKMPLTYADVYPGPVNVHQNVPLTDFAIAFEIDSGIFIGPQIAPLKTGGKRSDIFYQLSRSDVTRDYGDGDVRAVGNTANEIQQGFDTKTFQVVDHAFRDFLPDEVADNADEVLDLTNTITTFLTTVLEFGYDKRLVQNVITAANFPDATFASTNTGGDQLQAALPTNRIIHRAYNAANLSVVRSNLMMGTNHVIMNADVAQQTAESPEIADIVKHQMGVSYVVEGGWAGPNFGLPTQLYGKTVVVVPHVENTAKKGQTDSFSDLLADSLLFLRVEAPSRRTRNAVTTFRKDGLTVRTYRDEGRKGTFIEVEMIQDERLTNANGGFILTDVLS